MTFIASQTPSVLVACCYASGLTAYDVSGDGGAFIWSVQVAQEGLFLLAYAELENFLLDFYP
jgi:hypothetical protein